MTTCKDIVSTKDMKVIGCRGCCNYPNGKIGIAAMCVAILGYILAIITSFGCRYFKQTVSSTRNFYFGLFSYQDSTDGTCISWSDSSDYTASWSFARAMAIIATILGTIALGFTLSLSCVSMPNLILKIMSVTYLVSGLCLILTLVAKAELDCPDCSIATGGVLAIITPIIYFITAVLIFKIPLYNDGSLPTTSKTKKSKASGKQDQVTITVTELPDGSKKTVKTTVDADGTTTIEETLEPPQEKAKAQEEEVTYLPDGSIKTTRVSYDESGAKVVHEIIEKPSQV